MKKHKSLSVLLVVFLLSSHLYSQINFTPISAPPGDPVQKIFELPTFNSMGAFVKKVPLFITEGGLFSGRLEKVNILVSPFYFEYSEILDVYKYGNKVYLLVEDVDGSEWVDIFESTTGNDFIRKKSVPESKFSLPNRFTQVSGDAVYAITNNMCYVTRDNFATLQADTAGLGGAVINSFDLDSLQNVYAVTSKGLFKQGTNANTWTRVNSFPLKSSLKNIYIDASQRIYISTGSSVYYSSDNGNTWTQNNSGLNNKTVNRFGEDDFKNIYVLADNFAFKSSGGTGAWGRIDKPVSDTFLDVNPNSFISPLTSIGGDLNLYLGTQYGLFVSQDQGATWSASNDVIKAQIIYGFAKSGSRTFVSTSLGLFYANQSNSTWTKVFPTNGYSTGKIVYADQSGNVYTLGKNVNVANYYSPSIVWKSTDNGNTWNPDTSGFGAFLNSGTPQYFVDENKVQHLLLTNSTTAIYKKSPSDSKWIADITGLPQGFSAYPTFFTSDNKGTLYAAFEDYSKNPVISYIFKRPIAGGSWVADTVGLGSHQVWSMSADANLNMILGTGDAGIFVKVNGKWTSIPSPSGLGGNAAFVTVIDKYGAMYTGFSNYNYKTFSYFWHGVFKTTNNGSSWTKVGLDSVAVKNLVIYGDTLYAVSYYKGLFKIPIQNPTEVKTLNSSLPSSFELYQNYPNPFNPSTVISFEIPKQSHVQLKIFDVIGREVATLVNEKKAAGKYEIKFDGTKLTSGIYFCQINTADFVQTRKMVLLK